MNAITQTVRFNGKCNNCKTFNSHKAEVSVDGAGMVAALESSTVQVWNKFWITVPCKACKSAQDVTAVRGKFSAKIRCSEKCESSTSHQCSCSCGGKNHGGRG